MIHRPYTAKNVNYFLKEKNFQKPVDKKRVLRYNQGRTKFLVRVEV